MVMSVLSFPVTRHVAVSSEANLICLIPLPASTTSRFLFLSNRIPRGLARPLTINRAFHPSATTGAGYSDFIFTEHSCADMSTACKRVAAIAACVRDRMVGLFVRALYVIKTRFLEGELDVPSQQRVR